jgi:hypothetical protein
MEKSTSKSKERKGTSEMRFEGKIESQNSQAEPETKSTIFGCAQGSQIEGYEVRGKEREEKPGLGIYFYFYFDFDFYSYDTPISKLHALQPHACVFSVLDSIHL